MHKDLSTQSILKIINSAVLVDIYYWTVLILKLQGSSLLMQF